MLKLKGCLGFGYPGRFLNYVTLLFKTKVTNTLFCIGIKYLNNGDIINI